MIEDTVSELRKAYSEFLKVAQIHASRHSAKPCIYEYYAYTDLLNGIGTCTSVALIKHVYRIGGSKLVLVLTDIGSSIGEGNTISDMDITTTTLVLKLGKNFTPESIIPITHRYDPTIAESHGELELSYNVVSEKQLKVKDIPKVLNAYYSTYLGSIMNYLLKKTANMVYHRASFESYAGVVEEVDGVKIVFQPKRLNYARPGILLKELSEFTEKCLNTVVEYPGAVEVFGRINNVLLR